ncbi:MAG: hypothetical protein H0X70_07455 [Segetibacter sp.]|nr:hypothetical protein [Segetibacter sp.]
MKSKYRFWLSILALVTIFASCSKDPLENLTEEESRIYITNGATYNYSAYNKNNISNLSSVAAHAGVVFSLR